MNSLFLSCLFLILGSADRAHANALKYFGYYASAMQGVGSGDYTDEVKDHSNVIWIRGSDAVAKLSEAKAKGIKAVVDIESVFFTSNLELQPAYSVQWQNFAKEIASYSDLIVAFYPKDEPFEVSRRLGMDTETMKSSLETVAAVVKKSFPNIPVAMLYTTNDVEMLRTNEMVPDHFDWFGFDCYNGSFDNCSGHSIPWYTDEIRAQLKLGQKIILVPQASIYAPTLNIPRTSDQSNIANIGLQYLQYATSSDDVVALFPFIFQTFPENHKYWIGARDLPVVLSQYKTIGKSIVSSSKQKEP